MFIKNRKNVSPLINIPNHIFQYNVEDHKFTHKSINNILFISTTYKP